MEKSAAIFLQIFIVSCSCLSGIRPSVQYTSVTEDLKVYVSDFQLPWLESQEFCKTLNMSLLSVDEAAKDKSLVKFFVGGAGNDILLGNAWTSAIELVEGVWNFDSTKEPTYYTRWFVGQPDDLAALNCVYLAKTALLYWRDANCSAPMYFICE